MSIATLTIDLDAVVANWRSLDALSAPTVETSAVVKADGYGCDSGRIAHTLAQAGVKTFFVAAAEEGIKVRFAVGPTAKIFVFGGHCAGDAEILSQNALIPLLNSPAQVQRHITTLGDHSFGLQLDSGMNRLGIEPFEMGQITASLGTATPLLVTTHLACADDPTHPQNQDQLQTFKDMTTNLSAPRSLAATGGTLMGPDFHFDLCRPGVGLYGGLPFADAKPVVNLDIPVIQIRDVAVGETVGYAASWTAKRPSRIATIAAGYADGLIRAASNSDLSLWSNGTACPLVGRVSMDLITVDVTDLDHDPDSLDILNDTQTVDTLADAAGTIGYEILTSLGARYNRRYIGG